MPLNNATADELASNIRNALNDLPRGEDQSLEAWKIICRNFADYVKAEATVSSTIPSGSIATPSDIGPPAPVNIGGTIS